MGNCFKLFATAILASMFSLESMAQIDINTIDFSKPKYVLSPKNTNNKIRFKPTVKSNVNEPSTTSVILY